MKIQDVDFSYRRPSRYYSFDSGKALDLHFSGLRLINHYLGADVTKYSLAKSTLDQHFIGQTNSGKILSPYQRELLSNFHSKDGAFSEDGVILKLISQAREKAKSESLEKINDELVRWNLDYTRAGFNNEIDNISYQFAYYYLYSSVKPNLENYFSNNELLAGSEVEGETLYNIAVKNKSNQQKALKSWKDFVSSFVWRVADYASNNCNALGPFFFFTDKELEEHRMYLNAVFTGVEQLNKAGQPWGNYFLSQD